MVFTRFLGRTDSLTHTRTDRPEYRMTPATFTYKKTFDSEKCMNYRQTYITAVGLTRRMDLL